MRTLLAPIFGVAMALCFATGWLLLERAFTSRTLFACLYVAAAAALSAGLALAAARILARRPWSARFAASLALLIAGTGGLTSLFMAIEPAWTSHPLAELPPQTVLLILATIGAASLYSFLAIAGLLMLPLGLPVMALFAALIARGTR